MGPSNRPLVFPQHLHSLDETLIVEDGSPAFMFTKPTSSSAENPAPPYIQLFSRRKASAWDGERYVEPKILAHHGGKARRLWAFPRTFNNQARKVRCTAGHQRHTTKRAVRFTPDGKAVL